MNEDQIPIAFLNKMYAILTNVFKILISMRNKSLINDDLAKIQLEQREAEIKKRTMEHEQHGKEMGKVHNEELAALYERQVEGLKYLKKLAGNDPDGLERVEKLQEIIEKFFSIKNKSKLQ